MATSATKTCRRRVSRVSLAHVEGAVLEFAHPARRDGPRWTASLEDMSVSGLSFVLPADAPRLDSGTELSGVTVRVGTCELRGDLLVMHVTPHPDGRLVCGALFYPSTDTDLVKLKSMIATVEALGG